MVPLLLFLFCLALGIVWSALQLRRAELERMARTVAEIRAARKSGSHRPRVRAPLIDLTRCLGCAACVPACPEDGVLALVHGQAAMVHGANCVGHGRCAESCPSGAIRLDWGALDPVEDLPALTAAFEVRGRPGLYLIGEATGHGLIRNAVHQGRQVARQVVSDLSGDGETLGAYDLVVVGAGPGGLACAMESAAAGLRVALLERHRLGGTIYHYPREKLILTEALELPGHGRLEADQYSREDLLQIWQNAIAGSDVHLFEGLECRAVEPLGQGEFEVQSSGAPLRARRVCLAPGVRGRPRSLNVPGESLDKVHYRLLDPALIRRERVLVVGGGESAVESALALSEDQGNRVTLAHRGADFVRVGPSLRQELERRAEAGTVRLLRSTEVERIEAENTFLRRGEGERIRLRNDRVLIHAGAVGPREFLQRCGIPFGDGERSEALVENRERIQRAERRRLLQNIALALALSLLAGIWCWTQWDYYGLALEERPLSSSHGRLRPSSPFGLILGWLGVACLLFNTSYLLRRVPGVFEKALPPRRWFSLHVATGLMMLPLALIHGALRIGDTTGGHAIWVVLVLLLTGAIGRYVYAFLPRAASGHGSAHEEVRAELSAVTEELRRQSDPLGQGIERSVEELCDRDRWGRGPLGRLGNLHRAPKRYRAVAESLRREAEQAGRSPQEIQVLLDLLRRSYEGAQRARHLDDLRSLLGTWRHLHVWLALLLYLLLGAHIYSAWKYGEWWPF